VELYESEEISLRLTQMVEEWERNGIGEASDPLFF
jgi:hypothetical protein